MPKPSEIGRHARCIALTLHGERWLADRPPPSPAPKGAEGRRDREDAESRESERYVWPHHHGRSWLREAPNPEQRPSGLKETRSRRQVTGSGHSGPPEADLDSPHHASISRFEETRKEEKEHEGTHEEKGCKWWPLGTAAGRHCHRRWRRRQPSNLQQRGCWMKVWVAPESPLVRDDARDANFSDHHNFLSFSGLSFKVITKVS